MSITKEIIARITYVSPEVQAQRDAWAQAKNETPDSPNALLELLNRLLGKD